MTREEFYDTIDKCRGGDYWSDLAIDTSVKYVTSLEQRIVELEAPKTCEGCIHQPLQGENYYEPCGTCKQFYADYYEPKEIK